jgi:alkanesulfonate monooxygenase SsuD/methylene tetrahydromethanopterin reductase-like flavin-dependent oxidoreductase (luciferase family)
MQAGQGLTAPERHVQLGFDGSPSSVAKRLGELYDDLGGFGQIIGLLAIGPSTHEQVMRSSELFATEVMPVLCPPGNAAEATS